MSHEALEEIRMRAVKQVQSGQSPEDVIKAVGGVSMINLTIQEASLSDSLTLDLVDKLLCELSSGEHSEKLDRARVLKELKCATNLTTAFLASINNNPVGIATVSENFALYAGGRYGVINEMLVDPAYRSRGVGKRLIERVKQFGQQRGWLRIDVTAPPEKEWVRTVTFYEREGFRFTGPKMKFLY